MMRIKTTSASSHQIPVFSPSNPRGNTGNFWFSFVPRIFPIEKYCFFYLCCPIFSLSRKMFNVWFCAPDISHVNLVMPRQIPVFSPFYPHENFKRYTRPMKSPFFPREIPMGYEFPVKFPFFSQKIPVKYMNKDFGIRIPVFSPYHSQLWLNPRGT